MRVLLENGDSIMIKSRTVVRITGILLLIATIVCAVTGLLKWPGLIPALGLRYRDVPVALITDIHDWSGLIMTILVTAHVFQFRGFLKRMVRKIYV
jgi:cytochrome b subunit of formate dehydrogenase